MRLLSTGVAELESNVRWLMEQRMQVVGEVALETPSPRDLLDRAWLHRSMR